MQQLVFRPCVPFFAWPGANEQPPRPTAFRTRVAESLRTGPLCFQPITDVCFFGVVGSISDALRGAGD